MIHIACESKQPVDQLGVYQCILLSAYLVQESNVDTVHVLNDPT